MANKWEWEAGRVFMRNKSYKVCRHRIAELAEQMNLESYPYTLVLGQRKSWLGKIDRHTWIEIEDDGKVVVLEPSQHGDPRERYRSTARYRMNQGIGGEHWVGQMFINRWLKEIR